MHNLKKTVKALAFLSTFAVNTLSFAENSFHINSIEINGLQRISKETVLNYIPLKKGQLLTPEKTNKIIHDLYQTDFFKNIQLTRNADTLVINLVERPTIAQIEIKGNKAIDKDKLQSLLKSVGLIEGRVFDRAILEKIKKSLEAEYHNTGRYNARVKAIITPEKRSRVSVKVVISEGRVAQIKQILFIGNKVFSSKTLLKELSLETSNWLTWITRDDQFSSEKLSESLKKLTHYYMDRGYIKFTIDSSNVSITPDKKNAYLTIRLTEGSQYKIKGYKFAGKLILAETQLEKSLHIKPGSLFSRQAIMKTSKSINYQLGNQGYIFANVNPIPEIDENKKEVFITFYIDPGQRVYIRRINFTGNIKTADEVLRREVKQKEGSLAKMSDINSSKRNINMLRFLQNATVKTLPVQYSQDEIDLMYQVNEVPAAEAKASLGYGTDGLVYGLSVVQANAMGTGKNVQVSFDNSPYTRTYSFSYNNPYYTNEGIQRGFSLYSQRFTPGRVNLTSAYTYDTYGGNLNYLIPINGKDNLFQFGVGYQYTKLNLGSTPSLELQRLIKSKNGAQNFNQVFLNTGFVRNTLDKPIFPTRGLNQSVNLQMSLPGGGTSLKYYKINVDNHFYFPLNQYFTFASQLGFGYGGLYGGEKEFPLFQNYYAGGIGFNGAVRGYASNSLGPKDSQSNPIGGNLLIYGNTRLILPNFISDKVRTSIFLDAGNVYNTHKYYPVFPSPSNSHSGSVRYSAGIGADFHVPSLGILNFSLAKGLNKKEGDQLQFFQFTFGTAF